MNGRLTPPAGRGERTPEMAGKTIGSDVDRLARTLAPAESSVRATTGRTSRPTPVGTVSAGAHSWLASTSRRMAGSGRRLHLVGPARAVTGVLTSRGVAGAVGAHGIGRDVGIEPGVHDLAGRSGRAARGIGPDVPTRPRHPPGGGTVESSE